MPTTNATTHEHVPLLRPDDDDREAVPHGAPLHSHAHHRRQRAIKFFGALFAVVLFALITNTLLGAWILTSSHDRLESAVSGITADAFAEGLAHCDRIARARKENEDAELSGGAPQKQRKKNPRYELMRSFNVTGARDIIIKNVTLVDEDGVSQGIDIAFSDGVIVSTGKDLSLKLQRSVKFAWTEIDATGFFATPGIVDMHSHVGASGIPSLAANADENEAFKPTNPQLRIQDGISFIDEGIDIVASGGVTTSLVLPGSATLMGGEGLAIKMLRPNSSEVEDMTVNRGMKDDDGKKWRYLKMACGENPKRVGRTFGQMPMSRMGNGWLFRERLAQARDALIAQDDWCAAASAAVSSYGHKSAHGHVSSRFPNPIEEDTIIALLRGDVKLQVHCYETHDIEMMVRNTHEFGFKVQAFHHAVEAHLVAPLLARENIAVAIFADHAFFKKEAYSPSTKAGQILHKAGVKVAYKSDHPVLNAQHLIFEAQKAAAYGLPHDVAIAAVTSVPADRIGLGWRIGRIAPSYDADIVIWDRYPLDLGASPLKVFVDGYLTKDLPLKPIKKILHREDFKATSEFSVTNVGAAGEDSHEPLVYKTYSIVNASRIFIDDGVVGEGSVVVENGIVNCLGDCHAQGSIFDVRGGVVIPGLVGASLKLGMEEIAAEASTHDGVGGVKDAIAGKVRAVDGLRVGNSKVLRSAWAGGVVHSVSLPSTDGFVQGLSVAFRTNAQHLGNAVAKDVVALHVTVGDSGKSSITPSISSQFATLTELLSTNTSKPFADAASGKIPLIVNAHDPSDITRLLHLKRENPSLRLVIAGATGAHIVATDIAKLEVPVLLLPARCYPTFWDARWCIPPGRTPSAAEILVNAGVTLLVSQNGDGLHRNLLWEAGWILADSSIDDSKLDENVAIGAVTWNVAKAFGIDEGGVGRIVVGQRAALVAIGSKSPLGFKRITLIADGDEVAVIPQQE